MPRRQTFMLSQQDLCFSHFQFNFCRMNKSLGTCVPFKNHVSDSGMIKANFILGRRLPFELFMKVGSCSGISAHQHFRLGHRLSAALCVPKLREASQRPPLLSLLPQT